MIRLTVLHTNDLHGRVEQLARIASLVRSIRHQVQGEGGVCYYFDCGDSEDNRQLESSLTKGAAMDALLAASGCDAAALGNAIPIRYGHQAIAGLSRAFGKPILCANLLDEHGQQIEGLQPYQWLELDGFKIVLIGLTDPLPPYETIYHLKTSAPQQILPELVLEVRAAGARTVILLSHLSSPVDLDLAASVPGVDLILGGHDHKILYPPQQVNGCWVAQTGQFGQHLGRLDLTLDEVSGKVLSLSAQLLDIPETLPQEDAVVQAMQKEQAYAQDLMQNVIGIVEQPLDLAIDRECAAADLLADALLARYPQAECALTLVGHWLTPLPAGEISQGGLFAACRSTANPCITHLTGAQILEFLRNGLKSENSSRVFDRHLRGGFVGWPHVAGLQVQWDGVDTDSVQVWLGNEALQAKRTYTVAATDMEFSEFIGYLILPDERVEYEVPTVVPEVLQEHITRNSPIWQIPGDRITLIK
ncbi:MAG: bifunctional UDP-sugar hydrolase/5'-nucleotidase [Anaerolineaceae bacterium]|nr:bifunctional UDP-sugar hydrolase/5'-nucleotidase [Anaerolineaceae bacterium]